jgi:acyl-CoA dehydrogenase
MRWYLGLEVFALAEEELAEVGRQATDHDVLALAARAEREPPVHVPYGAWGQRIDEIHVSDAYLELGRLGIKAGVTALPYEKTLYREKARLVWGAILMMWGSSSALYSCPVAMTDGAARTLLEHGDVDDMPVVGRLTSRDPSQAWTSGQWMTETTGGSDVSRTETVACRDAEGSWSLYGTKWFTSAITSETALTLARPDGAGAGAGSLALFRVDRQLPDGGRNRLFVRRLKEKLGTRAMPTAELELDGAVAVPVGDPTEGGGVRKIATMLNITRIHNALGSAGALGRGLAWARAYASVREIGGEPLDSLPAHRAVLADLSVDYAAALALSLRCCDLLGRAENGIASREEALLLRTLTPLAKLTTARWAVAGTSEAMESVGGVGYCEDSTIPALVRNTHVLTIWEGTTTVLALDFLRAISLSDGLDVLLSDAGAAADEAAAGPETAETASAVRNALRTIGQKQKELTEDQVVAHAFARTLAIGVATTYAAGLLARQGLWAARRGDGRTAAIAARLVARGLLPPGPAADIGVLLAPETGKKT